MLDKFTYKKLYLDEHLLDTYSERNFTPGETACIVGSNTQDIINLYLHHKIPLRKQHSIFTNKNINDSLYFVAQYSNQKKIIITSNNFGRFKLSNCKELCIPKYMITGLNLLPGKILYFGELNNQFILTPRKSKELDIIAKYKVDKSYNVRITKSALEKIGLFSNRIDLKIII